MTRNQRQPHRAEQPWWRANVLPKMLAILFLMVVLVVGYYGYVIFIGPNSIEAEYPGMRVRGRPDDWGLGWEYDDIDVTSPVTADLDVQLGTHPAVSIKDLTLAVVEQFADELRAIAKAAGKDPIWVGPQISFQIDGHVRFFSDRNVGFCRGGKRCTLPVSKREFEAIFGKPLTTNARRRWL